MHHRGSKIQHCCTTLLHDALQLEEQCRHKTKGRCMCRGSRGDRDKAGTALCPGREGCSDAPLQEGSIYEIEPCNCMTSPCACAGAVRGTAARPAQRPAPGERAAALRCCLSVSQVKRAMLACDQSRHVTTACSCAGVVGGTATKLAQRPAPGERAAPMRPYRKAALMR